MAQENDLIFMHSDHEPFIVSGETGLSGFLAHYIRRVTEEAGIKAHWSNVPWEKQLPTLKRNKKNVCALTLFKTPEREAYLQYTTAVGPIGRFVLIAKRDNPRLAGHKTFRAVVHDDALKPILQPNVAHNAYIDRLLEGKDYIPAASSVERIIRDQITDNRKYLILAEIRAKSLLLKLDMLHDLMAYRHFADISDSNYHYIGCSLSTDKELFARLNNAIIERGPAVP